MRSIIVSVLCLAAVRLSAATPPTVQSVLPPPGTIDVLTQVTVLFSEPVTGVAAADLLVNGIAAADLSVAGGGTTYTFTFASQPAYGTVQISWDSVHNITDLEVPPNRFNEAGAGATWQYNLVDATAPVVTSAAPAQGVSVRSLTQIEVSFSEPVAGVDAADLLINNSPASGLSVLGVGKYRFTFSQPASGTVQVTWAAGHNIRDFASTPNSFAGGSWTYLLNPNLGLPSIRINEFLAANLSGLADEDVPAEPQDWIEIWNYGASVVNLNGYALTDDRDDPGKWTFPSTNLAPGQFLAVFASEKDRRTITNPAHRFHTNFKLSGGGEYLALFNAESPRVMISEFTPEYPEQRNDYSFGYDAGGALKYFATPTPGAANGSSAIATVLSPPHFNVDRGIFDQPFTLILNSSEPGATIRYTTDGAEPTEAASLVYNSPLSITNTMVLRAAVFRTNALPSSTVTHSYFFLEQIVQQPANPAGFPTNWGCCGNVRNVSTTYTFTPGSTVQGVIPADYAMDMDPLRVDPLNTNSPIDAVKLQRLKDGLREIPTLSIVMKTDDIFGIAGLYQRSADETGTSGTKPDNKKPCSIEMILPDGSTAFATTCGIDLHGNASRNPTKNPKHGFKLHFRGDFGPGTLEYRLFEDSTVEEYDDVLLRADFNSSWRHWSDIAGQGLGAFQRTRATRTRDAWMKDSVREMGGLASHSRFVHLYLNGLYWGTYDFSEDPRDVFAKNALGGAEGDFDLIDQGVVKGGTADAYNAMRNLPAATTLTVYEQYFQYLNLSEFADYMLLHFFMGHQDWATSTDGNKNWAAVRKRVAGPEGVFHYQAWDGECILLSEDVNRTTLAGGNYPTGLHGDLDDSPEYRLLFADRVHRHMIAPGGALTPPVTIGRWQKWQAVLDKPIVAESVRWGDYRRDVHQSSEGAYQLYTREAFWVPENNRMVNSYFPNRNATVLGQLRAAGLYPNVSAPVFNQQGGFVAEGFNLTMTASNTIYYTLDGSDPRVYGSSAVSPGAQTYGAPVALNTPTIVKARALFGTNWSALNEAAFTVDTLGSPLRITEIMYNPIGGDAYEYIELQNVSPTVVNVGYYSIDGLNYAFPPNTLLQPGQVIVLGSDASPATWTARYPGVVAFGRFDGKLDNSGEKLGIRDATGKRLWSVDYDDDSGWPAAADGQGPSLEIIDVFGDPDASANWRASTIANGTPGTVTPPPPPPTGIVINELMADNGVIVNQVGLSFDWIELHNIGAQTVNLANWSLSDSSDPRRFLFPSTNVPPGGYLFVWMDPTGMSSNELRASFGLERNGQSLFLYDASTNLIDSIGYGFQLTNYSIGRVNGEWQLTQPTPKAANIAAAVAPTSNLVINEWLANAAPGSDDWVELFNRSVAAPVGLRGIYLGASDALHQMNALSFIAPGGYVQLLADENSGANHLDFKLPAVGGTIVLYSESGAELDRVTYGAQAQSVSQGRLPDGNVSVVSFPASQSPAASNYLLSYTGPFLNEVLAINNAAITNGSGRTADFVELRNTNGAPFALSGMRLSTDPENASQWVFPAGVSIPANGYLIVWFDNEMPASAANGAVLNTGQSLDGESSEVWLFNSVGQPVDSVVFGFQIADLSIGLSGGQWTLLASATPGTANSAPASLTSAAGLRINEWSADPATGNDWFEIYNSASQPVSLAGLYLTDNPSLSGLTQFPLAPLNYIGAKGYVRCIADADQSQGRNHVNFNLDAEGEILRIASPALGVIDTVSFGAQATGVSQGRLPDGSDNVEEFPGTATPADSNYRLLSTAVINEVLTHTDDPLEDAIEIYNPTGQGIDLGGWFLSDSASDLKKYRVPDGTFLPAGGYRVSYQAQFNSGAPGSFTLDSAGGDQVHLSEADAAGNLSGRRAVARFGAAANGVSFGRYETCHGVDFVPMSVRTFGQDTPASLTQFRTGSGLPNAYPKVGPVVINEIMYHPPGPTNTDNTAYEYVELHNFSAGAVTLYDAANPANTWRLRGGVSFVFPQGASVSASGYVLVVSFDPAADPTQLTVFRSLYGISTNVPIYGPYDGNLDNGGESIELYRPDTPQAGSGYVPYLLVDRVEYGDSAPWPVGGDGDGASLQRGVASEHGNDASNWSAAGPTAGRANPVQPVPGPSIVAQPISRAVLQGSRVVFNVSACGGRPLTYQWKFNGSNLTGETNVALVIASAQAGHVGSYTVLVGNGAGSELSAAATLAFGELPVITQQPQPQTAGGGSEATFSVSATGAGPLSYQWRRNGRVIPGATNAVLLLTNLRFNDTGDYSVLVMNSVGAVASSTASLVVLIPPTITSHPQSQSVAPNAGVTFSVSATGVGTLRYQWQFNGQNLSGQTNSTLNLAGVTLANEGDYRVLVSDDITGGLSQVARLTVRVPAVILSSSGGVTNVVGSTISLSVTASGSVPMAFRWYKGSSGLITNILFVTNCTFSIFDAKTNDTATYRVVLTNSGSPNPSVNTTFVVRVVAPPVITNHPASQIAAPGNTATFTVGVGGSPPFNYQWRFQGAPVANATNSTLAVTNVGASDQGGYEVVVSNFAGSVTSAMATLAVTGPPTIARQPQNREASIGGLATFNVLAAGLGPLSYQWQFNGGDLNGQTSDTLSLVNIQAGNVGAYRVVVGNTFGSTASQPAQLSLLGPATLQNPVVLGDGSVSMGLSGPTNRNYAVEISSNLTNWTTLTTLFYTNGVMPFTDSSANGTTNRFYRTRLVQ
jgi:hypothetical protein